ncbi:hypothetical protein [Flavobacterium hydrophilum]|nr:hypothetical protein [Flavobacterium hydrophilum]
MTNSDLKYSTDNSPVIELNEVQEMEIFLLGDIRETLLNQVLT